MIFRARFILHETLLSRINLDLARSHFLRSSSWYCYDLSASLALSAFSRLNCLASRLTWTFHFEYFYVLLLFNFWSFITTDSRAESNGIRTSIDSNFILFSARQLRLLSSTAASGTTSSGTFPQIPLQTSFSLLVTNHDSGPDSWAARLPTRILLLLLLLLLLHYSASSSYSSSSKSDALHCLANIFQSNSAYSAGRRALYRRKSSVLCDRLPENNRSTAPIHTVLGRRFTVFDEDWLIDETRLRLRLRDEILDVRLPIERSLCRCAE